MTIQSMKCFVAVAQTLSFARASEILNLSQPAVTQQIKNLEQELGVRLIDRTQYHISLTPAGYAYYEEVSDILDRISAATKRVQSNTFQETLHVGCESTIQLFLLDTIYRKYHEKHPNITINNTELNPIERKKTISNGLVDVMFCSSAAAEGIKGISYAKLFGGHLCCVVPNDHPLASKDIVFYEDLQNEILILLDQAHCPAEMDILQKNLLKNCPNSRFCFSGSSLYSIPMIAAGLGIAVMPNFVVPYSDKVTSVPFSNATNIEYGIAWVSNDTSEKVRDFVRIAKQVYAKA